MSEKVKKWFSKNTDGIIGFAQALIFVSGIIMGIYMVLVSLH